MIKNRNLTTITFSLMLLATLLSVFSAAHLAEQTILERLRVNAKLTADIVHESRRLYSDEAVARLKGLSPVEVSNRYLDFEHGIPNPATFTILLGERLTNRHTDQNLQVKMYSDLPFKNRKSRNLDEFAIKAVEQVRLTPGMPFQSIEEINGQRVLRYADPMIMQPSCVNCHVTHPDSPKRDWVVGDVRGVLEVTQSISSSPDSFQSLFLIRTLFIAIGSFSIVAILLMLIRNYREKQQQKQNLKAKTEQLEQQALTDALTGIPNRRRFDQDIAAAWGYCSRNDRPLSIGLIDIDYFKRFNDSLGHPEGDKCLQQIAACLKNQLKRPVDLVARYGGEEFALLLPETDYEGAVRVLDNLQQAINALQIPHPDSPIASHVTASFSMITVSSVRQHSLQTVMKQVDEALYQAKQQGRNRQISLKI